MPSMTWVIYKPALASYTEALQKVARRLVEAYEQTPESLQGLAISLGKVGDVERDLGDLQMALASYTEALQLGRRLVEAYGQTPDTLRSLSVGLDQVGDIQRDLGDLQTALASYTEALQLDRHRAERPMNKKPGHPDRPFCQPSQGGGYPA